MAHAVVGGDAMTVTEQADRARAPRAGAGRGSIVMLVLAVVAAAFGVLLPASAAQAFAKPPVDWSFYISTSDTVKAYQLGCNQGQYDHNLGNINSDVVLDFGGQRSANDGTIRINDGAFMSYATIESVAESFAQGYYYCTGADVSSLLFLELGTNNSAYNVSNAGGVAWGNMVKDVVNFVNSHYGQVIVQGANDIEPSWHTYGGTHDWALGFGATSGTFYMNYGSADGCPTTSDNNGGCNNGWNQYDVWFISYGYSPAITAPEIYFYAQAQQWTQISHYGRDHQAKAAHYTAPWDENDLDSHTFTTQQAWDNLTGLMGEPCPYSMQIHWE
jgi:hypothetical protein